MTSMQFPRTNVAGVSLPRIIIGTNWILGYSHTGYAAEKRILERNNNKKEMIDIIETYMTYGINAIMAPLSANPFLNEAIQSVEQKLGQEIIRIDTPNLNVDNSNKARKEAQTIIHNSASYGSRFCLIHHSSVEQLVNKNKEKIERLPDYLEMIRAEGMIPGLSAHMPEIILYSDSNEYDVETYIQIFNCLGFMMQIEVETVSRIIHNAKKPVMSIKPLAAGRTTPYIGLTFSFAALRSCDMVTLGAFTPDEVHEDVEIALAALEHRYPNIRTRSSPAKKQSVLRT